MKKFFVSIAIMLFCAASSQGLRSQNVQVVPSDSSAYVMFHGVIGYDAQLQFEWGRPGYPTQYTPLVWVYADTFQQSVGQFLSGLTPGYPYQVRAIFYAQSGQVEFSSWEIFHTCYSLVVSPEPVQVFSTTTALLGVQYNPGPDLVYINTQFFYGTDSVGLANQTPGVQFWSNGPGSRQEYLSGLQPNTRYFWMVCVRNQSCGWGLQECSGMGSFVTTTTSAEPEAPQEKFSIVNPVVNQTLQVFAPNLATLSIFSLSGEKLHEGEIPSGKSELGLPGFPAGLYLYRIQSGEKVQTGKILLE